MTQRLRVHLGGAASRLGLLGCALCAAGLLAASPMALLVGQVHLLGVLVLYLSGLVAGARLRESLRATLDAGSAVSSGALAVGDQAEFELSLRADQDLSGALVVPTLGAALALRAATVTPTATGLTCALRAEARRAGATALHGVTVRTESLGALLDLDVGVHAVKVVVPRPHAPRLGTSRSGDRVTLPVGLSRPNTRGLGSDIRELRDHVPGDPFKHIAWKASARRGRLVVKEFEDDGALSVYLVLDMSPALRVGEVGQTALDTALSAVLGLARQLGAAHHRVGLAIVDREVHEFVRADAGPRMIERVVDALLTVNSVVDARLTEASTEDVGARVARFLALHYGRDVRLPAALRLGVLGPDVDLEHAADVVRQVAGPRLGELRDADAVLRRFCQLMAIELPYRSDFGGARSGSGLLAGVEQCVKDRSANHLFIALVEPSTVDIEVTTAAARLARAHGHRLMLLPVAGGPRSGPPAGDASLETALQQLWASEQREQGRDALRRLRSAGIAALALHGAVNR